MARLFAFILSLILLAAVTGCSDGLLGSLGSQDNTEVNAPAVGIWPAGTKLPSPRLVQPTKTSTETVPPKNTWNFTVQLRPGSWPYYAQSVWKAGNDTIIKGFWIGEPNKWNWQDGYMVFTQRAMGVATVFPKGSETYLINQGPVSGSYSKTLTTIREWSGSGDKVIDFNSSKTPMVLNYSTQKTSAVSSSLRIEIQSDNNRYPRIGTDITEDIRNGAILEGTGRYRLIVKSSGCNWRIFIGVE